MNKKLTAEFILLASVWGASFLLMRLASVDFGPWATAGLRVTVASAVLLPWVLAQGHGKTLLRYAFPLFIMGLLNAGIPFALYSYAVLSVSTGLSAVLNATTPLFGALVAWVWLKERPNPSQSLGLGLGFLGVLMLSWDKADFSSSVGWSVLACVLATLCYGVAASFTKKYLSGLPPLLLAAGCQIGAMVGLLGPAWFHWPSSPPRVSAWLAVVAVGIFCTALAYIMFFRLIERAGPSKTLTVTFLTPFFALLYGHWLLDESFSAWMALSGGVILLGVALATGALPWSRKQRT